MARHIPSLLKVAAVKISDGLEVVIEGPNVEAVTGRAAKELAIKTAQSKGYFRCGINKSSGPYIVDDKGNSATSELAEERWNQEAAIVQTGRYAYRNDYKLLQGIGV